MQIDFHHAATYVIARLAGFPHPDAATVAHAAQLVDDADEAGLVSFVNHEPFGRIASARTLRPPGREADGIFGFEDPLAGEPNLLSWMPFHFLPGNLGKPSGQGLEAQRVLRLVCHADSPVAERMNEACIAAKGRAHSLHRLGITAHVYADTFVHAGFIGLCHPLNEVRDLLPVRGGRPVRNTALRSRTPLPDLPDRPYLDWSFLDRDGIRRRRDNVAICMNAARRLFSLFQCWLGVPASRTELGEGDANLLREAFSGFQDPDAGVRHTAWMSLLAGLKGERTFSFGPLAHLELKSLQYWPTGLGSWKWMALGTPRGADEAGETFLWTPDFETSHWRRFHEALKEHRAEIMGRILPEFDLQVRLDDRLGIVREGPPRHPWTRPALPWASGFHGSPA
jgi:hypothetical protein